MLDYSCFEETKLKNNFLSSKPFNYLVIDNFLEYMAADKILDELNSNTNWDIRNEDKIQVKYRSDWKENCDVPENTYNLIQTLNSGSFLRWLSKVTDIKGIIPDPYLTGGGFNKIKSGGVLAIHADGNWHDLMGVHRRLNIILYLNKDWDDTWGGDLELWSKTENDLPKKCEVKIKPIFNRLVIFKTDDFSFHGHPTPVKCPDDNSRKSLILYYYTSTRPEEEVLDISSKHRALFYSPDSIGIKYE